LFAVEDFVRDAQWQGLKSLRESWKAALRGYRAAEKFRTGQERQGLKPDIFPIVYGPTKVVP
jgi:hypothetical protein